MVLSVRKDMKMSKTVQNRESGNVLFLILIAVALFAALSYAVTSSTNSGGGNANDESNLVNSAAVTQYPASIKTAMIRMMVSNNIDAVGLDGSNDNGLLFDKPPYSDIVSGNEDRVVFHPSGGGASYTRAPTSVMDSGGGNLTGDWFFNIDYEVDNIGTTANGSAGNEIIAFLPGLSASICNRINVELGITGDTILSGAIDPVDNATVDDTISTANAAANGIGTNLGAAGLDGQPYGCFRDGAAGDYIYYHVLLER